VYAQRPNAIPEVSQYLRFGPSPRGGASADHVRKGQRPPRGAGHDQLRDVADAIIPALRHRLLRNFQAEAENVSAESILEQAVKRLKRPR